MAKPGRKPEFHDVPITKIISRYTKSIENCAIITPIVDRLYVYDNSINDKDAQILYRLSNGALEKRYINNLPDWASNILP